MARGLPLGTSVASWPMETSTAHDIFLLWAMVFLSETLKSFFWPPFSTLDNVLFRALPLLLPSETRSSQQPSQSSLVSRRMTYTLRPTKTKLDQVYVLNGNGHHLKRRSLSLLRVYSHLLRTLILVAPMALNIVSKSLKTYRSLHLNRFCWRFVCGHEGPCLNLYATTVLLNVFNSCPSIIISKNRIMCSQDIYYLHRSDPKPLLYVVKQTPSSYKSIAARTRAAVLLRVVLLKTRSLAMVHLSTLHSLMTVTILSSIDSFMEDPSSNRDLTCVKSPSSICLKALMEPLSISTIYLFVALGNVLLVYVLNSESFDLSFLCIWFFLD
ncbi:unnamed protein product [Arabidopsis thaliana]|uniref:Uncharacterized protein n=1 Tax=Arabidopsis thaliana TaxID=3702 RepID=A0A654EFN5_ARATH|nr:unnamed protein product [Arabidopsis thaliana]